MMNKQQEIRQQGVMTLAHHDFQKGLNARAFFKVHDHAIGQDLVQSTFLKTWMYLVKGGKIDIMKAFLYHILNNLIVDEYRKRKSVSLDTLVESGFDPAVDDSNRMFDVFDGRQAIYLIKQLSEKYQKVMRMRYVQQLSLKEIALLTMQTRNTVAVQVHRGLAQLKLLYHPVVI